MRDNGDVTRIVIIGGGPGGYEAALVAAQLGAQVTMVEQDGPGGACVLTDCVPSKTLIATSVRKQALLDAPSLGVSFSGGPDGDAGTVGVDLPLVNKRVKELAQAQSADIATRVEAEGVEIIRARGGGWSIRRWCGRATGRSGPTWCWWPPGRRPGCCPAPSPTASAYSTGVSSTTWRSCPSTSSSSGQG
ncbi:hypothetical protein GCM10020001_059460 [Nonomuraea salmonea]